MAEGWARKWISDQILILGSKTGNQALLSDWGEKESLSSDDIDRNRIQEKIAILKNTIVVSVALDSSSVFKTATKSTEDLASPLNDEYNAYLCRKQVKPKAVEAMKKDGVDIASHQPKTVDEIIHVIRHDGASSLPDSMTTLKPFVPSETILTPESDQEQETEKPQSRKL
jgi:hypothetical protein